MRKLQLVSIFIVVLSFIVALAAQPMLPKMVAVHWGINGEPNGFSDSGFAAFFVPVLEALLVGLFFFLPSIDPMKKNYAAFQGEYDGLVAVITGFMLYVYLLTLAINLGYALNMLQFMSPGFAVLFFYLGMLMQKAKQNWFVGFRTPWTLSSRRVWDKTHALAGKMLKAAGVVALIGIALPRIGLVASVAVVIAAVVIGFVYSYLEYRKEGKGKR
jgi:uncharacterized membrane protein